MKATFISFVEASGEMPSTAYSDFLLAADIARNSAGRPVQPMALHCLALPQIRCIFDNIITRN